MFLIDIFLMKKNLCYISLHVLVNWIPFTNASGVQQKPAYQKSKIQSPFTRPMVHRAAPISVSFALGHTSANAVKTTAGGWSTVSSTGLTFPLHSHMSRARREGSEYHF